VVPRKKVLTLKKTQILLEDFSPDIRCGNEFDKADAPRNLSVTECALFESTVVKQGMSKACCDRTRGNGFKLKDGRRKTFFMMRMVKHWHRLLREVVDPPSPETFKVRLDGALSNLI